MTNKNKICIVFVLVFSIGLTAFAQTVSSGDTSNTEIITTANARADYDVMLARSSVDYRVTPGDIYTLTYAAGGTPVTYIISVDTSYRLRVANMGFVNGAGKTFIQVKNEVEAIVTRNFPLSGVQLVLTQPGVFRVFVNGEVYRAMEVSAWGLSRLSSVIDDNLTSFASTRDITIRSSGGQVRTYDLFKARRMGDLSQNPYLRPGDIITFNRLERRVTINGAVERPGTYQLLRGENFTDLINIYAINYLPLADKTRVSMTRYIGSEEISGDITYLSEEDLAANFELKHLDTIYIPNITARRPAVHVTRIDRSITINGAVRRPGTYQLMPHENLLELIEAYGDGFSPLADPSRIELVRLINSDDVAGDILFLSETDIEENFLLEHYDVITIPTTTQLLPVIFVEGAVGALGSGTLSTSNRLAVRFFTGETYASLARKNIGWFSEVSDTENAYVLRKNERIPVNLNLALYDASYRGRILVEENDVLIIPFRQYFVSVAGSVRNPGRYPYIPDRDWEYYIGLAGGFIKNQNARDSITIVDLNGNRLRKRHVITPETTITARTNHFLYNFNQYGPVMTTMLSVVTTFLTILIIQGN